ncbi:hypothetical protein DXG01_008679 [Tephrocybe rancida]|nr:hypothetical protein DXG01_008679 [Tephrocybe rancida]
MSTVATSLKIYNKPEDVAEKVWHFCLEATSLDPIVFSDPLSVGSSISEIYVYRDEIETAAKQLAVESKRINDYVARAIKEFKVEVDAAGPLVTNAFVQYIRDRAKERIKDIHAAPLLHTQTIISTYPRMSRTPKDYFSLGTRGTFGLEATQQERDQLEKETSGFNPTWEIPPAPPPEETSLEQLAEQLPFSPGLLFETAYTCVGCQRKIKIITSLDLACTAKDATFTLIGGRLGPAVRPAWNVNEPISHTVAGNILIEPRRDLLQASPSRTPTTMLTKKKSALSVASGRFLGRSPKAEPSPLRSDPLSPSDPTEIKAHNMPGPV